MNSTEHDWEDGDPYNGVRWCTQCGIDDRSEGATLPCPGSSAKPEAEALRSKELADHTAWLREHADIVELPGGKALLELIREERADEREACARLVEESGRRHGYHAVEGACTGIAAAIRARGNRGEDRIPETWADGPGRRRADRMETAIRRRRHGL